MATEITAYVANDGTLFRSLEQARRHEAVTYFKKEYDYNGLYGGDTRVYDEDLIQWLEDNKNLVFTLLGTQE
jgi:hypothetical protein